MCPQFLTYRRMQSLMNHRLGKELSTSILTHLYGNAIPYPFLKLEWLNSLQREEVMRIYLLGIGRNGGRPVRSGRPIASATNQITWMTLDNDPIGCPHRERHFRLLLGYTFRCGICDKSQAGRIQACSTCDLRMCSSCKENILRQHDRDSLDWSRRHGW